MVLDTSKLKTVANVSRLLGYTSTYLYRLLKNRKITGVDIDGVTFIDTSLLPTKMLNKIKLNLNPK